MAFEVARRTSRKLVLAIPASSAVVQKLPRVAELLSSIRSGSRASSGFEQIRPTRQSSDRNSYRSRMTSLQCASVQSRAAAVGADAPRSIGVRCVRPEADLIHFYFFFHHFHSCNQVNTHHSRCTSPSCHNSSTSRRSCAPRPPLRSRSPPSSSGAPAAPIPAVARGRRSTEDNIKTTQLQGARCRKAPCPRASPL